MIDVSERDLVELGFQHVDTLYLPPLEPGGYRPRRYLSKAERAALLEEAREMLGPDAHWHYRPAAQRRADDQSERHGNMPDRVSFIHARRNERCRL